MIRSIFRRIKRYKYILDTFKYIAEMALWAARLDFEKDILFFLWVRIPLSPIHFYFFFKFIILCIVFSFFSLIVFFILFSLSISLFSKTDIQQIYWHTYVWWKFHMKHNSPCCENWENCPRQTEDAWIVTFLNAWLTTELSENCGMVHLWWRQAIMEEKKLTSSGFEPV